MGRTSIVSRALRWAGLFLGGALLFELLRRHDVGATAAALAALGPLVLLVPLPQALGVWLHGAAFRQVLASQAITSGTGRLALLYLGTDAARSVLPGGPAVAEAAAAWHLRRHFGATWRCAIRSLALKKALVVATHGVCIAGLVVLARGPLERLGQALGALPLVHGALIAALVLLLGGVALLVVATRDGTARRRVADARTTPPAELPDATPASRWPAASLGLGALLLLGQWLAEILETWMVLNLLGVPATPAEAAVVELGGSLVRSAAFLVPGGLGVQDASQAALLGGLGLAGGATVAAFVVLKRAREFGFAALGLAVLALFRQLVGEGTEAAPALLGKARVPCATGGSA